MTAYEQLVEEGYICGRIGSGTTVSEQIPEDMLPKRPESAARASDERNFVPQHYARPARAFRPIEPAISEFPMETWTRVAARVMRRASVSMLAGGDLAGLPALRESVAAYLGAHRGILCGADQIVIVSGAQQALDLIARLLLKPGDPVWVEDPGYVGAVDAFRNSGAKLVPVGVDKDGLNPDEGRRLCPDPKAVYLTPAHQFGLGVTLSLARRLDLLRWSRTSGAVLIEDDYDSEFRFSGRPVPALRGLRDAQDIFHIGTFNKVLFPSLRLAYILVPDAWMDPMIALRHQTDRYPAVLPQAILTRFMDDGHFVRHLRRMRSIYAERRLALQNDARQFLAGALHLPETAAGLNTPAFLTNGMDCEEVGKAAAHSQLELWPLRRFALRRQDLNGFLMGFASFTPDEIRQGVLKLAHLLEQQPDTRTTPR